MIPVYYDEGEEVWRKADSSNKRKDYKWYDYDSKMWANSVTVTSSSRATYQNAGLGTEIDMNDILTMQVWIPRYKYKVWNYNSDGTKTSEPQEIEIVFEEGTNSTGDITCTDNIQGSSGNGTSETCRLTSTNAICTDDTCNNKYYTHPAFTFGSEELEGFWIGKFEVSSDIECTATTNSSVGEGCNLTTINPLVRPNVESWRSAQISIYASNIMKMNDEGNIYGFSTNVDTHLIKNMEWGAMAYFSHSKYGTCENGVCSEIYVNNCNQFITGIGANTVDATSSSLSCSSLENMYNGRYGMLASTTGNIYGIYDVSGGAWEYVMGNVVSSDGKTMISGVSTSQNSGYTGKLYNSGSYTNYTGMYDYPDTKYYDKYSFATGRSEKKKSKLGDDIKETRTSDTTSWYNDYGYTIYSGTPWYGRSGMHTYSNGNFGIFMTGGSSGYPSANLSSRIVIVN